MSAKRGQRANAALTEKQQTWIWGKSPDLSLPWTIGFGGWQCLRLEELHLLNIDLNDLKMTVETFAESLDVGEVKKCTRNVCNRPKWWTL